MRLLRTTLAVSLYIVLSASHCRKNNPVPSGALVEASGMVYDSATHEPVPGAPVYMIGRPPVTGWGQVYWNTGYLASTQSDSSGNFTISCRADGQDGTYGVAVAYEDSTGNFTGFWGKCAPFWADNCITFIGTGRQLKNVVVYARAPENALLTIKTSQPGDSLEILVDAGYYWEWITSPGQLPADTTITIRLMPALENWINYNVYNSSSRTWTYVVDSLVPPAHTTPVLTRSF